MIRVPFFKMQSVGNDFVLIHGDEFDGDLPELAKQACRRHFGVGSDGLLAVYRGENSIKIRMFNPDGSEDFCGNGIRCSVLHAFKLGWIDARPMVEHLGRTISARIIPDVSGDANPTIQFDLPPASYQPEQVPVSSANEVFKRSLEDVFPDVYFTGPALLKNNSVSSLSTGSTHTIVWVSELPGDDEFLEIAPSLEVAPTFPERTSIMFTKSGENNELSMRIWERGAGETMGCGTGSTAAAIDFLRREGRGGEVLVHNPGGDLRISASAWDRPVTVSGKADQLFTGTFFFQP